MKKYFLIIFLFATLNLHAIGDAPSDLGKYIWILKPLIDVGSVIVKVSPKEASKRLNDYEQVFCVGRDNKGWRVNYILDDDSLHDEEIIDFMYDYHTDKQNKVLGRKHKKILQCLIKNDDINKTERLKFAYAFFIEENYAKVIERLHSYILDGDDHSLWIYYALTKDNCKLYNFHQKDKKNYIPICPNKIDSTSINDAKEIFYKDSYAFEYKRKYKLEDYTIALFEDETQQETQVKIQVNYKNKQVPYTILDQHKNTYQEKRMSDENGYGTFTYIKGSERYFFTSPQRHSLITVLEIVLDKEKLSSSNLGEKYKNK